MKLRIMKNFVKSIFVMAIVGLATTMFASEYKFPGWDKDASVYEADIARYEAAPNEQKPFSATNYNNLKLARALAGKKVDSFDDIYSAAKTAFPGNDFSAFHYAYTRAAAIYFGENQSQKGIDMLRSAYALSREKNTYHCGVIVAHPTMCKSLVISDDEGVTAILIALNTTDVIIKCGYKNIAYMLDALYNMLPGSSIAEAEQLATLKKFNRRFSVELLGKNKEQWEPIIAKLRTVIASY